MQKMKWVDFPSDTSRPLRVFLDHKKKDLAY